ncbi:MAG: Fic family protein, partial [Corynebacterium variabile]
ILLLIQQELLDLPVLYLSGVIVSRKNEYYDRLLAVTTHQDWEGWVLFMLKAVEDAARDTAELINDLRAMQEMTSLHIRDALPAAPAMELAKLLFTVPYVRIRDIEARGLAKRQTASNWLSALADAGILEESRADGRQKVFINRPALEILTRS